MKPIIVIKIGGLVASDTSIMDMALREILEDQANHHYVLVHGGGKEVSAFSEKLGHKAVFQDGIRVTRPEEMEIVEMILAGKVNGELTRRAQTMGMPSAGVSGFDGKLFTGEALEISDYPGSRTGKVTHSDPNILKVLLTGGYLPVVNSISCDAQGNPLNINADEAALAVAKALRAYKLIFISDIPGILWDGVLRSHWGPKDIQQAIDIGVISGGMIPKVTSSLEALENGVSQVVIGGYQEAGDLQELVVGTKGSHLDLNKN